MAASAALAQGSGIAPFTSEHAARGVTYIMMLSLPLPTPSEGFGMAAAGLEGGGDLDGDGFVDGSGLGRLLGAWGG